MTPINNFTHAWHFLRGTTQYFAWLKQNKCVRLTIATPWYKELPRMKKKFPRHDIATRGVLAIAMHRVLAIATREVLAIATRGVL